MIRSKILLFVALVFFARTACAQVFINEIAWMGTTVSSSNEWVELSNSGTSQVSLEGWILTIEGKKEIVLTGNISAGGFYLIERTDDSTVPTITADVVSSFGSGINNAGGIISLKDASGAVVDRVDGSQGWLIGGNQAGDNTTKDTAQKGPNAWFTGAPTPRAANSGVIADPLPQTQNAPETIQTENSSTPAPASTFPVDPQIFADAGLATLTVSTGATVTFMGRVWGLKKEPLENARMVWAFGDGGIADGTSVSHVFYYPGEYTVVLDAASGFYAASDRIRVTAVTPAVVVRTGGDAAHSFVALQNNGNEELNLSSWQIVVVDQKFIIPKNTFVGAKKTLMFASEVTGLSTPLGSVAILNFPNGTRVGAMPPSTATLVPPVYSPNNSGQIKKEAAVVPMQKVLTSKDNQEASVADVFSGSTATPNNNNNLWVWYTSVALLGVVALLGLRFVQRREEKTTFTADDFEIIEEFDENEPH